MPTSETNVNSSGRRALDPAQRALRRAERCVERGQVDEAIQSLEMALEFGADRYSCYLRLARLYQMGRRWQEAVSAAEKAIAERPDRLSAREAVIALHLESRNYARAVDASKALLKLSPRHVPARDALGTAYIGLGDVEAAMRVANDLIRIDPHDPTHHFKKALLCQHRGEMRLAIEELERVLAMAPESDIAESARDQLDTLDTFQLEQILTLAVEDIVFRAKLLRDPDQAAVERGYYLSETGRYILHDMAAQGFPEIPADCRPSLYH